MNHQALLVDKLPEKQSNKDQYFIRLLAIKQMHKKAGIYFCPFMQYLTKYDGSM